MIDQNSDGFIDKDDLIEMLTSLGKNPDDNLLDNMINEARFTSDVTFVMQLELRMKRHFNVSFRFSSFFRRLVRSTSPCF